MVTGPRTISGQVLVQASYRRGPASLSSVCGLCLEDYASFSREHLQRRAAKKSLAKLKEVSVTVNQPNLRQIRLTTGNAQQRACWPSAEQMLMKSVWLIGTVGAEMNYQYA